MRLATIIDGGHPRVAVARDEGLLALPADDDVGTRSMREIAAAGPAALARIEAWAARQPARAVRPIHAVEFGPAIPDPGAIYTIGDNYRAAGEAAGPLPDRPLVYGKAGSSVAGHGARLSWDRTLTPNVDPEVELGVVIGSAAFAVPAREALAHVFGYTCIDDVSSRDPWLDGDQWLIGKSMPGFCPVGPWIVTADEIEPDDLGLGCTLDGVPIQDGRTSQMRSSVADIVAYLSRHVRLRPGDLIATGTPHRLDAPPGRHRHLQPGDEVTVWIDRIGRLTTRID